MKIIYLHQHFFTPQMIGVAGTRSYELGRRLAQMGHSVEMITSASGQLSNSTGWYTTTENAIRVHWLPNDYSNKMPFRQRVGSFVRFAYQSAIKAVSLKGDVIYATSGPLTIAIPAIIASLLRRTPMVFEVRDLWPEGAIQLGVLKNPIAILLSRMLERMAYRQSRHIVALSPGMKDGIAAAGVPRSKISIIPNACDLDLFHPSVDGSAVRAQLGIESKFSLAYFGTMGLANGLDFILDAAKAVETRGVDDVVFILHGDGMTRSSLEQRTQVERLQSVIFSDPVPDKTYVAKLAAAVDVCMTIYKNVPVLFTCSPNKLFDAFAAGRVSLTNMPGALQKLIEDNKCGVFVRPDDPDHFADQILRLKSLPVEEFRRLGANARTLGVNVFSRDLLADKLERILKSVAVTGHGPQPPLVDLWK